MRLLLDTNAFLWWRDGSPRLSALVRNEIGNPANDVLVSIASLWEIAIKRSLGKLRFLEDFEEVMAEEEFGLLTVNYSHLRSLGDLSQYHRDPFDRIIIAQSFAEDVLIATDDRIFAAYNAKTIW